MRKTVEFEDVVALRSAITSYCVSIGRDVHYTRNAKNRIGAKCKGKDCQWYLWASLQGGKGTMTVKTHFSQHNCGRLAKVRKIRASWIAKQYHPKFNVNPYLKCQEIVNTVWTEWGIKISLWMALKARRLAQKLILADDLGTVDGGGYTIMYDQQKGLLKAVFDIWPSAKTRVYARHANCNFRQVFGGSLQYRLGFWRIAKSTTENIFNRNMEEFSKISAAAGLDLLKRNYMKWVRAFFTPQSTCETIDNNMNEVFNAYILSSRHKPIITMLEDIRESLMERLHKKRDFIAKKEINICPRIQTRLEKSKINARGWSAFWDGHYCYGVREGATQTRYVVILLDKTCSCNAWQLSGVPCHHVVAAIWKAVEHPEHYVSEWFSKETYLKAY
ncbi:uncharacterized protein LOC110710823 [Chenopodium quinoa]|uniref:uncharacterized protein LOC110710823 n=1 Tax=Chenopodium quinoa TaxID=63459 RepID=UPI000B779DAA|nr:uncharacterized protein LOC110710823 [Chenopodium quinoa]